MKQKCMESSDVLTFSENVIPSTSKITSPQSSGDDYVPQHYDEGVCSVPELGLPEVEKCEGNRVTSISDSSSTESQSPGNEQELKRRS